MPEESTTSNLVDMTRRVWAAVDRQDWDAVLSFYAADACLDMSPVGLGTFEGHAALRSEWEEAYGFFDEHVWEPGEILDLGHGVVFVALGMQGRVPGGSGSVRANSAWIYDWKDGKIARVAIYEVDEGRAAAERLAEEREGDD
jgi:ketosteroid isomerase-like protein